MYKDNWKLRVW